MPYFLWQGKYTSDSFKSFVTHPDDRSEVARKHIEGSGGKMHFFFYAFGEWDAVILSEFPTQEGYIAAIMAVAAGGAIASSETTVLYTAEEGKSAMAKAGSLVTHYKLPGR